MLQIPATSATLFQLSKLCTTSLATTLSPFPTVAMAYLQELEKKRVLRLMYKPLWDTFQITPLLARLNLFFTADRSVAQPQVILHRYPLPATLSLVSFCKNISIPLLINTHQNNSNLQLRREQVTKIYTLVRPFWTIQLDIDLKMLTQTHLCQI